MTRDTTDERTERASIARRVFLGTVGALGVSAVAGSSTAAPGDDLTGSTETTTETQGTSTTDHDHSGDHLGSDEPVASITAKEINGVLYANAFAGESGDEKIQNAVDELP